MTLPASYGAGVHAAEAAFGIRTAMDVGRMPDSPKHLGATRFTDALAKMDAPMGAVKEPWQHKLERAPVWGNKVSPEAASNTVNNDPKLRFGGV